MPDQSFVFPSDRPSIQSRVLPTDSPSSFTGTQNKYRVECYDMYSIHSRQEGYRKRTIGRASLSASFPFTSLNSGTVSHGNPRGRSRIFQTAYLVLKSLNLVKQERQVSPGAYKLHFRSKPKSTRLANIKCVCGTFASVLGGV